jgi:hypothetical protein
MKHDLPRVPPLLVCDAGRQYALRKLTCSALLVGLSVPFGFMCATGFLRGGVLNNCLAAWMGLGVLICFWVAVLILCFGHLTRVELYADRILVYDKYPNPAQYHFTRVKEILWNEQEGHVCVYLVGVFANGRAIERTHFTSDEQAIDFVARANEVLRAFRSAGR